MSTPDKQEKTQAPEKLSGGEAVVSTAEKKASGEAESGKDGFYENLTKQARALRTARESGLRTGTHQEFGTPTIDGDKGTLIKGGAPSKATLTPEQRQERMKEQTGGNGQQPPDAPATVDQAFGAHTGQQGPAEQTGTVIDYKPAQTSDKSLKLGMDYEEKPPDMITPIEKLGDFMQAAARRATDPEGWKAWAQGEINKFAGVGAGLNEAKEKTKAAVAAGWKAMTDGTVVEFLSQPNAINAPVFKTVANAFDAMSKDPNAVNHAFEALGKVVMKASEGYSNLPDYEKGKVIGKVMFGMVNPEGSTEGAEAALKVADQVATNVDKGVWDTIGQTVKSIKDMAPDLAEQTKQALYDYIKRTGLTGPELETAGIPNDYFAAMHSGPGPGKGDNLFAMSKAEEGEGLPKKTTEGEGGIVYQIDKATGRLQRTDLGKVREPYDWEAINERFSPDVLRQLNEDSCISAVGDMLSEGRITQEQLMTELGKRPDIADLREHLGTEWTSQKRRFNSLAEISDQPWGAELLENAGTDLQKSLHSVVVDGVNDSGNLMIRDPWEGTKYEMTQQQFLKLWNGRAVYRPIVE